MITFILILISSISMIATDIYLPSLPSMSAYFGTHPDHIQLTVSSYFIGSVISAFFTGVFTDKFGYRKIYIGFMFFFVLSSLLCALAKSVDMIIFARSLQGLSRGVFMAMSYAVVLDLYGKQKSAKVIGIFGMSATILPGIAPIIGGYVDEWFGWRMNFYIIFFLAITGFMLALFFFKPNVKKQSESVDIKNLAFGYMEVIKSGPFLAFMLPPALLYGGWFCVLTVFPFYFIEIIKIPPSEFGFYNAYFVFLWGFGCFLSQFVSRKFGMEKTLFLGLWGAFFGALGLLIAYWVMPFSPILICLGMTVHLLSYGILYPPTTTLGLSLFENRRGIASSLSQTLSTLCCGVGAYVASLIDDTSFLPISLFMVVLTICCILIATALKGPCIAPKVK